MAPEFFPFIAFACLAIVVIFGSIAGTVFVIASYYSNRNRQSLRLIATVIFGGTFVVVLTLIFQGWMIRQQYFLNEPFVAACAEGDMEQVQELLACGASPDAYGVDYRETALIAASENSHVEIVKLLLSCGADPKKQDFEGKTALQHARESGCNEIVAVLEQHDAR